MKRWLSALLFSLVNAWAAAGPQNSLPGGPECADRQGAESLSREFLALVDSGLYEAAWASGTSYYRATLNRQEWLQLANDLLSPTGQPPKRQLLAFRLTPAAVLQQDTRLAIFDYAVTASDGSRHNEQLAVGALPAEECGIVAYHIDVRRIALNRLLDAFLGKLNRAGGRFDYSDTSLIEIERLLLEHAPGGEPRARQTTGADYRAFIYLLGQYLGEVLVRQHAGNWSHSPSPANQQRPLILMPDGRRIDPHRMLADFARHPAIGSLRRTFEHELAIPSLQP